MKLKDVKILAIETSCDETAAAIIGVENNQPVILSNIISSQIDLHAKTGGVVPEVASRAHMEAMIPVIQEALNEVGSLSKVTHIAVTVGPGLIGSLLVGFNTAKAMAYALDIPIIPINHIEGHIYSAISGEIQFPILALTVSGGHTSLTLMRDHGFYETIGQTRDDAAGEAFDKVAKLLDLGYPGGPIVSRLAEEYRRKNPNYKIQISNKSQNPNSKKPNEVNLANEANKAIILPRPMINDKSFDFSFSGLKTAVLDVVLKYSSSEFSSREVSNSSRQARTVNDDVKAEICAAFEDAAVDVLVTKTLRAVAKYKPKTIILAGGVAANQKLRKELSDKLKAESSEGAPVGGGYKLILPPAELCGDNAAMIGLAAYYHIVRGDIKNWNQIKIDSNLKL